MRKLIWLFPVALIAGCGSGDKTNTSPVFNGSSFVTNTETELKDQLKATDRDGDMLTYSVSTAPSHGSLTLNDNGDFVYLPNPEYTGFDTFVARVTDGELMVSARFSIVVNRATVSFLQYSKAAFAQQENSKALSTNGRDFTQDSESTADYADLFN